MAVLSLASPFPLLAQHTGQEPPRPWLVVGAGGEHQLEMSVEVSLNFERKYLYQVAYEFSGVMLSPFSSGWFLPDPNGYSVHALSVKLGVGGFRRWYAGGLFAGPALVAGLRPSPNRLPGQRPQETTDPYVTGGLGLGAELYLKPLPGIGAGVKLFANINPVRSVNGYRLSFLFRIPRRTD